ncbi:MAG TPA: 2-isopropylmalate synthase [Verrucomicrobiae bacterium]|nr:2-isopropylmalate synthase [Verrucomicrobiae bacterium]
MRTIEIFDTTLRDGEQSPGAAMTPEARLEIAIALDEAGADTIEAGFPVASAATARSVGEIARRVKRARVAALARCLPRDVESAAQAVAQAKRPRIHVFIATSDLHLERKLGITRERAIEMAVEGVRLARRYCDDVEFSAEDATRSDRAYLAEIFAAAVGAGATVLNVPDTVGYAVPGEMAELVRFLAAPYRGSGEVTLSVHTHDDLGMATANALAAIAAGASQVECTINGIGERAGNAALEEIVCALRVRRDRFACDSRFVTSGIQAISATVAAAAHMPVQKNKAVVGANAFAHESGIHQDGVIKERSTYEIIDAASVGQSTTLSLGRNSGRHALLARASAIGLSLDAGRIDAFVAAFDDCSAAVRTVDDETLANLAGKVRSG